MKISEVSADAERAHFIGRSTQSLLSWHQIMGFPSENAALPWFAETKYLSSVTQFIKLSDEILRRFIVSLFPDEWHFENFQIMKKWVI
jgi:hypothetical protein